MPFIWRFVHECSGPPVGGHAPLDTLGTPDTPDTLLDNAGYGETCCGRLPVSFSAFLAWQLNVRQFSGHKCSAAVPWAANFNDLQQQLLYSSGGSVGPVGVFWLSHLGRWVRGVEICICFMHYAIMRNKRRGIGIMSLAFGI